jgi:hypothetical protein
VVIALHIAQGLTFNRSLRKQITQLEEDYFIDYDVSEVKAFSQLWDDKGLRNWGLSHFHLHGFSEDDQLSCIYVWFSILYDREKSELELLIDEIEQRKRDSLRKFYEANKSTGNHISPTSTVQNLPRIIDEVYGNYS